MPAADLLSLKGVFLITAIFLSLSTIGDKVEADGLTAVATAAATKLGTKWAAGEGAWAAYNAVVNNAQFIAGAFAFMSGTKITKDLISMSFGHTGFISPSASMNSWLGQIDSQQEGPAKDYTAFGKKIEFNGMCPLDDPQKFSSSLTCPNWKFKGPNNSERPYDNPHFTGPSVKDVMRTFVSLDRVDEWDIFWDEMIEFTFLPHDFGSAENDITGLGLKRCSIPRRRNKDCLPYSLEGPLNDLRTLAHKTYVGWAKWWNKPSSVFESSNPKNNNETKKPEDKKQQQNEPANNSSSYLPWFWRVIQFLVRFMLWSTSWFVNFWVYLCVFGPMLAAFLWKGWRLKLLFIMAFVLAWEYTALCTLFLFLLFALRDIALTIYFFATLQTNEMLSKIFPTYKSEVKDAPYLVTVIALVSRMKLSTWATKVFWLTLYGMLPPSLGSAIFLVQYIFFSSAPSTPKELVDTWTVWWNWLPNTLEDFEVAQKMDLEWCLFLEAAGNAFAKLEQMTAEKKKEYLKSLDKHASAVLCNLGTKMPGKVFYSDVHLLGVSKPKKYTLYIVKKTLNKGWDEVIVRYVESKEGKMSSLMRLPRRFLGLLRFDGLEPDFVVKSFLEEAGSQEQQNDKKQIEQKQTAQQQNSQQQQVQQQTAQQQTTQQQNAQQQNAQQQHDKKDEQQQNEAADNNLPKQQNKQNKIGAKSNRSHSSSSRNGRKGKSGSGGNGEAVSAAGASENMKKGGICHTVAATFMLTWCASFLSSFIPKSGEDDLQFLCDNTIPFREKCEAVAEATDTPLDGSPQDASDITYEGLSCLTAGRNKKGQHRPWLAYLGMTPTLPNPQVPEGCRIIGGLRFVKRGDGGHWSAFKQAKSGNGWVEWEITNGVATPKTFDDHLYKLHGDNVKISYVYVDQAPCLGNGVPKFKCDECGVDNDQHSDHHCSRTCNSCNKVFVGKCTGIGKQNRLKKNQLLVSAQELKDYVCHGCNEKSRKAEQEYKREMKKVEQENKKREQQQQKEQQKQQQQQQKKVQLQICAQCDKPAADHENSSRITICDGCKKEVFGSCGPSGAGSMLNMLFGSKKFLCHSCENKDGSDKLINNNKKQEPKNDDAKKNTSASGKNKNNNSNNKNGETKNDNKESSPSNQNQNNNNNNNNNNNKVEENNVPNSNGAAAHVSGENSNKNKNNNKKQTAAQKAAAAAVAATVGKNPPSYPPPAFDSGVHNPTPPSPREAAVIKKAKEETDNFVITVPANFQQKENLGDAPLVVDSIEDLAKSPVGSVLKSSEQDFQNRPGNPPASAGYKGEFLHKLNIKKNVDKELQNTRHKGTFDNHFRCLRYAQVMTKNSPSAWKELPLVRILVRALLLRSIVRKWKAQTLFREACSMQGAMANLPIYTNHQFPIHLPEEPYWKHMMALWRLESQRNQPHNQTVVNPESIIQAIESTQVTDTKTKVALILQWYLAARAGDVLELRKQDVVISEDKAKKVYNIQVTFRHAKTVAKRGAYTVKSSLARKELFTIVINFLNSLPNDPNAPLFPQTGPHKVSKNHQEKLMRDALKTVDTILTTRSIRRGALQTMALEKVDEATLMHFSGHTNRNTLLRYLDWGRLFAKEEEEARDASAHLQPETRVNNAQTGSN